VEIFTPLILWTRIIDWLVFNANFNSISAISLGDQEHNNETKIRYSEKELLRLIHDHLHKNGRLKFLDYFMCNITIFVDVITFYEF
jgi:hypothetical protein